MVVKASSGLSKVDLQEVSESSVCTISYVVSLDVHDSTPTILMISTYIYLAS